MFHAVFVESAQLSCGIHTVGTYCLYQDLYNKFVSVTFAPVAFIDSLLLLSASFDF